MNFVSEVGIIEHPTQNLRWLAKEVLNFKEALAMLGISPSTLYKMTHQREINFYKPGGKLIFFLKEDLLNWMLQNKQPSNEEIKVELLKKMEHGRK